VILVIGSNGLVSTAIQQRYTDQKMVVVSSQIAKSWAVSNSESRIREYVKSLRIRPSKIINCAGLTNPELSKQMHVNVNFELPKNLLKFAQEEEIELITFGSVMENNPELCQQNPYLMSKEMFFSHLSDTIKTSSKLLHLQLHTLYGGKKLHSHMFLGQMFAAIQQGEEFKMTNGLQLREYHHIDDDIQALGRIIGAKNYGIIEISHNEKLTLRTIAEFVFSEFNIISKLKLGELPNPSIELYKSGNNLALDKQANGFRASLPGITDYLRGLLGKPK
jgi:nucleoside-diphosphate-sugar epimerase